MLNSIATPVTRGSLKAFDINTMLSDNNPVVPVFTPAEPEVTPSLAGSPAWVRMGNLGGTTVPYAGQGERISPYFGWMLTAFGIETVEVESESGCYLAAYAYNDHPTRSDVDSRMFLFYREKGSDGFYVLDGYRPFMPNEAVAAIAGEAANYSRLNAADAMKTVMELFHLAEGVELYSVMSEAWATKRPELEYWHGADRGPWDWKR